MSCRCAALLAVVAVTSCTDDEVPVVDINVVSMTQVTLGPPRATDVPPALVDYRWELATHPASSVLRGFQATTEQIVVIPDVRGVFVFDPFLTDNGSAVLTHHYVVTATGAAPHAEIQGRSSVPVETAATLDSMESYSDEHLPLSPAWRLVSRPMDSRATIVGLRDEHATLTPDVAGAYQIELRVFDGEVWSEPSAIWTVNATS